MYIYFLVVFPFFTAAGGGVTTEAELLSLGSSPSSSLFSTFDGITSFGRTSSSSSFSSYTTFSVSLSTRNSTLRFREI